MKHALPPLTNDLIEAYVASAVVWLVRLLGALIRPGAARRGRLLNRFVNFIEREVEATIFLKALHAFGPAPRLRSMRPRSTLSGFRRSKGGIRLLLKSARIRARGASLIGRATRLLEALAHSDRYVAHYMKRLINGLCFGRLVASAPRAAALRCAPLNAAAYADSS